MAKPPDLIADQVNHLVELATTPKHTYDDVAKLVNVSAKTIMRWVKAGQVPSPVYLGSTARFTDSQLATIGTGPALPGFYTVAPSPRAEIGKAGRTVALKRQKEDAKRKRDAERKRRERAAAKAKREGGVK